MSRINSRLAKLEQRAQERPARRVEVIEIHKAYEDGHTEIEIIEVSHDPNKQTETA